MKRSSQGASRVGSLVCPACEAGGLHLRNADLAVCDCCGSGVNGGVVEVLVQIAGLPEALGRHACECGHPEMRLLPDGVYRCPACASEVLPLEYRPGPADPRPRDEGRPDGEQRPREVNGPC